MKTNNTSASKLIHPDTVMAEQIRSFDWASTSIGAIDNWPTCLRITVNQMLRSGFPMLLWWGDDNIQIYNDACLEVQKANPIFKYSRALGQPGATAWPKHWPLIKIKKELIFSTGKGAFSQDKLIPIKRGDHLEDVYWTYSFDPVCNDDGKPIGLLAIFKETTHINQVLKQKEEEQAFLLKLSDLLGTCSNPEQIEVETTRMLGEYMGSDRVGFAEAHEKEQLITIQRSFVRNGIASLEGTYLYKDYGYGLYTSLINGDTVVQNDIANNETLTAEQKAAHAALQLGATVNIPMLKEGRLLAVLFVHYHTAHVWSQEELSVLSQSANRIWNAVLVARAEQQLKLSEQRYRTLFNSIDEAFMVIEFSFDEQGKPIDYTFLSINPAFEKQSGLRNVLGKSILQIMPDIETTWIEKYGLVAISGKPLRFEEYNEGTGGWYDVYAVAIGENTGQVVVIFDDITERKAEEQRKNDFLSMASHELKTPLTSVNGYLHILKARFIKANDTKANEVLERTTKQIAKMTAIINSFLNITRLDSGQLGVQQQLFDIVEAVQEAEEEAINGNSTHHFKFEPIDPAFVNADKEKITQVIENFINNAVKYSAGGSVIQLACLKEDNHIKVSVTDQGIGLDEADRLQIFERFYRVKNEHTLMIAGFGIGLYICKEIIERHGGQIGVESKLGEGSTFWFSLPVVK
jgi:two-component system sensor histidine kinase VicK